MCEARAARSLVFGAHVVPDVDGHDRRLAVGVHNHAQAVWQGELLIGDVDGLGTGGLDGRHECGGAAEQGKAERGRKKGFVSESHGRGSFGVNR